MTIRNPRKEIYKSTITLNGKKYFVAINQDLRWKKNTYRWTIVCSDLHWAFCGQAQFETEARAGLNEKILELSEKGRIVHG